MSTRRSPTRFEKEIQSVGLETDYKIRPTDPAEFMIQGMLLGDLAGGFARKGDVR